MNNIRKDMTSVSNARQGKPWNGLSTDDLANRLMQIEQKYDLPVEGEGVFLNPAHASEVNEVAIRESRRENGLFQGQDPDEYNPSAGHSYEEDIINRRVDYVTQGDTIQKRVAENIVFVEAEAKRQEAEDKARDRQNSKEVKAVLGAFAGIYE